MSQYRIVQISEPFFVVEELVATHEEGYWPWSKGKIVENWERAFLTEVRFYRTSTFLSQQAAQNWIDDRHKYPIVVKQPA